MLEFLIYDLKVAVLIAVFYMFYRLLLAKETFHRVNRFVLLLTAVASFVLPLCVITTHQTVVMPMPQVGIEMGPMVTEVESEPVTPLWQMALPILFIIGMAATLANTLWSVCKILTLIRHSEQHPQADGSTICVTGNAELAPFSWMHYIVMNRSDYEANDAAILTHERGHIRLRHSWDVLLVDILTALQWFNPAIWMLRSDLRAIHEYEADGAVLSQGINARQYQYLLITKAGGIGGYSLANGITHSALKNRIHMMSHKKSQSSRLWKLLALLPIVGITLALNAETVTDYVYNNDEPQKQVPVKKGKKAGTIKAGGNQIIQIVEPKKNDIQWEVQDESGQKTTGTGTLSYSVLDDVTPSEKEFDVVEEMPQFPGGPHELFTYLANNIRYPKESMETNKQGRVIVTFVIGKDGSISDARVVKSVDEALDAEALRVISSMPNWTPGKQNGKAVNVKYTVPITFRLDGKSKEAPTATGTFTPTEPSDAKLKEVVSNLPGAKIDENGNVTVNGKPVKKILVDGKPATTEDIVRPSLVIVDGKESGDIDLVMKSLDPKTIKEMTMLKDKAAIEAYGEKAKDGVVIITTKK